MPALESDSARGSVRRIIDSGEKLPADLRSEIMDLGPRAVPALVEILDDEELALEESDGEGCAPIHAVELLCDLRAVEAVEPMLRALSRTHPLDILHDRIIVCLPKIGPAAAEPALRAAASAAGEVLDSLAAILAELGLHDDRILDILLTQLRRDPSFAANLTEYGDPRALPALSDALDAFKLDETGNPFGNQGVFEIREAIEELGGTLTAEQQKKCRLAGAAADAFRGALLSAVDRSSERASSDALGPAHLHHRPGRNDPCPCGSGKKYKRCCGR